MFVQTARPRQLLGKGGVCKKKEKNPIFVFFSHGGKTLKRVFPPRGGFMPPCKGGPAMDPFRVHIRGRTDGRTSKVFSL